MSSFSLLLKTWPKDNDIFSFSTPFFSFSLILKSKPKTVLKPSSIIEVLFPENKFPDACDNTLKIAERVEYIFKSPEYYLPDFPVPDKNKSTEEFLYEKVQEGAKELYPNITKEINERIDYELEVINSMVFLPT